MSRSHLDREVRQENHLSDQILKTETRLRVATDLTLVDREDKLTTIYYSSSASKTLKKSIAATLRI